MNSSSSSLRNFRNEALRDEVERQNHDLKAFQERYDNLVAMYESQYSSLQTLETDK